MNDTELADAVVALGIIKRNVYRPEDDDSFIIPNVLPCKTASEIVTDWRVAGALMEKCLQVGLLMDVMERWDSWALSASESLPSAIIEACVEALK